MRFLMSLDKQRTLPQSPPEGSSKTQKCPFSVQKCTYLSVTKFFVCENRQRQRLSCKAFIGLSIHAKMVGGDFPFYVKIGRN